MDRKTRNVLSRFSPLALVIAVFLLFSFLIPDLWLSWYNFSGMLEQAVALGMAALGLTISLVVGEFDMSVGSMVSIGSMVSMMMIAGDKPIIVAVLLTVLIGALGGVVNGFIRTVLRIPGVIPTIGTQSVFAGIALLINSGNMVYGSGKNFTTFTRLGRGYVIGFPIAAIIFLLVAAMVWFFVTKTRNGRAAQMVGGNDVACGLSGIPVNRYIRMGFIICAMLGAVGGIMAAARSGSGNPKAGVDLFLDALIAVNLGSAFVAEEQQEYSVVGTTIGVLFIIMTINGLQLMGKGFHVQCIMRGILLILARALFASKGRLLKG